MFPILLSRPYTFLRNLPDFNKWDYASSLAIYPIFVTRPHCFVSEHQQFSWNTITHLHRERSLRFTSLRDYQQVTTPGCYHTSRSGWCTLFLRHQRATKYDVEIENVLHTKKEGMKDVKIFVSIQVPGSIFILFPTSRLQNMPQSSLLHENKPGSSK